MPTSPDPEHDALLIALFHFYDLHPGPLRDACDEAAKKYNIARTLFEASFSDPSREYCEGAESTFKQALKAFTDQGLGRA